MKQILDDMQGKNNLFLLIICGFCALTLLACSNAERTARRADAALAIGEYEEAASLYKRAYSQVSARDRALRGKLAYSMGEAFRHYGNVSRALSAYKNAERYGYTDSTSLRGAADMMRYAGDYKGA